MDLRNNEYQSVINLFNHDSALTYTFVTAIAASVYYYVRIPAPFLSNQKGFWLDALGNNTLTLRLRT